MIRMIADDAGEGINLKIQEFGRLTKTLCVRDLCIAAGYVISVQETCASDIGFVPLIHLRQTIPQRYFRHVLANSDVLTVKTADRAFDITNGYVMAPRVSGLGITPQMEVLREPAATY